MVHSADTLALEQTDGPRVRLLLMHKVADALMLKKIRAVLGGRAVYAISGGAPLGERLGHFYRGLGLIVLEGYGLTETTAPVTVNRPSRVKLGTVGTPLPGPTLEIGEVGEVLATGSPGIRVHPHHSDAHDAACAH